MLFDDPETGVVIADQRSGLRLCRLGEANELVIQRLSKSVRVLSLAASEMTL
jgi:hypothetical protein